MVRMLIICDIDSTDGVAADVVLRLKALLPRYDEAVELTWVAAGITDDDICAVAHPNPFQRKRNRAALKRRSYRKWQLLCHRDFFDILPRAFEGIKERHGMLMMKAERLRLNMCEITPASLADELKISVATLYRRYGRAAIKRACGRGIAVRVEAQADAVRHQLQGYRLFKRKVA